MIYVRMYETGSQASDAVIKLQEDGFPHDTLCQVIPGVSAGESRDNLAAALAAGFIHPNDFDKLLQALISGRCLVMVNAAFGFGQAAVNILDSCGPVSTDLLPPPRLPVEGDKAAPFSSAMQWSVLKRDQPAPFSSWLGLKTLSATSEMNRSFGFPLLSDNPAPLSSLTGLKILMPTPDLGHSSFGWPLLMDEVAPLSSRLGFPLLISKD